MITLEEQIKQMVFERVKELNGSNTEEDLSMIITEKLIHDKFSIEEIKKKIEVVSCELDDGRVEPNGAWIYKEDCINWIFEKFDTIGEAIRGAVKVSGAIVLCNGEEIKFDTIDDELAYYIDNKTDKVKVVELNV